MTQPLAQPPTEALKASTDAVSPEPPRRTAWSEGVERLRAAASTEPGRLRVLGAALAALLLAFGAVTAWQVTERADASRALVNRSQPLSEDAAAIYRSLADANTTAASGFLAGGDEPRAMRERYLSDIRTASQRIARAATSTDDTGAALRQLRLLNEQLPVYTGLVESARANNRQGLPVGGAYLRYANAQMEDQLLPAAQALYDAQAAQLEEDYQDATAWPWLALVGGALALGALVWAQQKLYRRTNRVFNRGLLAGTAAAAGLLLWLAGGHSLANLRLDDSDRHGAQSLDALNQALISALETRGDESMTLVSRGAGSGYEQDYQRSMEQLAGSDPDRGDGGLMAEALKLADDSLGRQPVETAARNAGFWRDRHDAVRKFENQGEYEAAVAMVTGSQGTTGETFDRIDANLRKAMKHEQAEFRASADDGRAALDGLPLGAGVLALLGATGAVLGIGRRLSEYR